MLMIGDGFVPHPRCHRPEAMVSGEAIPLQTL